MVYKRLFREPADTIPHLAGLFDVDGMEYSPRPPERVEDVLALIDEDGNPIVNLKTKLAVRAAIKSTPTGKLLTKREVEHAAKVIEGTADAKSLRNEQPLIQDALIEVMNEIGITIPYIGRQIKAGMEATKVQYFADKGIVQDARETVDWSARHAYLQDALDIFGVKGKAPSQEGAKHLHLHYKSQLGDKTEIIDVSAPKSDVVKRRMEAHKPQNRKGT